MIALTLSSLDDLLSSSVICWYISIVNAFSLSGLLNRIVLTEFSTVITSESSDDDELDDELGAAPPSRPNFLAKPSTLAM